MNEFLLDRIAQIQDETQIFAIGLIGLLALATLLPWRIFWLIRHARAGADRHPALHRASALCLALALYTLLEAVVVFATAKGGEVSGLMIPLYAYVPFMFYLLFEAFQAGAHRLKPEQE